MATLADCVRRADGVAAHSRRGWAALRRYRVQPAILKLAVTLATVRPENVGFALSV